MPVNRYLEKFFAEKCGQNRKLGLFQNACIDLVMGKRVFVYSFSGLAKDFTATLAHYV